jgi:diguanylate cyclase (GGDEF)-like protein/PAS domain S-box-containing protein
MSVRSAAQRPLWRSPLTLVPLILCVLALAVLWQVRTAEDRQAEALARVAVLDRRVAEVRKSQRAAARAAVAAAREEVRELDARADWLTWLLGGLMLPAAGLLLLGGLRRREEEGGRARRDERRLRALVQHSTDMIMVLDRRGSIMFQSGGEILGHKAGALQRRKASTLVHADEQHLLGELLAGTLDGPQVDWRLKHSDGHWVHVETSIADMRTDPDVGGIILTSRDVTARRASEAQLRHRAFHDPLTQLPNRALFYDRIEHAQVRAAREGHRVAVCMLDLDDFKGVNDTLGHAAGDELLVQVAQRLRGCLRSGDTAARLGGDEFGVLLEAVAERSEPIQVAERLLVAMRQPFDVAGEALDVRPSIGVAIGEIGDDIVEDLLRHGDVAMYAAKRNGKGRYEVYDAALAEAAEAEEGAAGRREGDEPDRVTPDHMPWFRRAEDQRAEVLSLLESDDNVHAMYQPLLDLRTGRIAGFEALARFRSPTHRPPNVWFSQAHRAGLGPRLEAAALTAALSTPGRPPAAFLSVNVSPSSLTSSEVMAALPADLSQVVVEITENELVTAAASLHETLDALRKRGARIAVDDAGAGYAGFTQLLRIRPHIIKLDRALVHGVSDDAYRAALISSFVSFARSIDALICAEGIESLQDLRTLADLDVTYGQGYALAPPHRGWPEVDESAVASVYTAWHAALHGRTAHTGVVSSSEAALERVAACVAGIRGSEDIPAALDVVCRDLSAERGALRRVRDDGTLATLGGVPLTAGPRLGTHRPEFAEAGGRLLVLPIEIAGSTVGVLELLAPESRPWHRNEIHRARVLAQLFAPVMQQRAARLAA